MKALLLAVAIVAPQAVLGQGQQETTKFLDFVHRKCPIALNESQAFIAKFPQATASGGALVVFRKDQSIVQMQGMLEGYKISADWSDHGSRTMRHYSVDLGPMPTPISMVDAHMRVWSRKNFGVEIKAREIPVADPDGSGGTYRPDHSARYITFDSVKSQLGTTFTSMEVTDGYNGLSVSIVHPTAQSDG